VKLRITIDMPETDPTLNDPDDVAAYVLDEEQDAYDFDMVGAEWVEE